MGSPNRCKSVCLILDLFIGMGRNDIIVEVRGRRREQKTNTISPGRESTPHPTLLLFKNSLLQGSHQGCSRHAAIPTLYLPA